MIASARVRTIQGRKLRADRILDSAGELLCRWGYDRVTIDDVAEHAKIGKGTVYLHWKTREELFYAVILRANTGAIDEFIAAVGADPREALLHRMARLKYLSAMRRPILRAVVSADLTVLGRLASSSDSNLRLQTLVSTDYFQVLMENNVVRPGLSTEDLTYGVAAITVGFFTADPVLATFGTNLALEHKADLLAAAIERTFSAPASPEALKAIQPPVIEMLERGREISQAYLQRAYEPQPHGTGETS